MDMGVDLRLNTPVESMKWLLEQGYDAIFIGSGAPKGKELDLPGRQKKGAANIHIGIDWLESVAFKHTESIGKKGTDHRRRQYRNGLLPDQPAYRGRGGPGDGAQTARVLQGLGLGTGRPAEEEQVEIVINRSPKSFVVEDGQLKGMMFRGDGILRSTNGRITDTKVVGEEFFEAGRCDPGDRPGDRVSLDRAGYRHRIQRMGRNRSAIGPRSKSTLPGVFFGGDAAFGPENIIWAGRTRPPGGDLHPQPLSRQIGQRPACRRP